MTMGPSHDLANHLFLVYKMGEADRRVGFPMVDLYSQLQSTMISTREVGEGGWEEGGSRGITEVFSTQRRELINADVSLNGHSITYSCPPGTALDTQANIRRQAGELP